MVTTSLLKVDMEGLLAKLERLADVKLPRDVVEVSLEPKVHLLCVRFKKPRKAELGEPLHPNVHLFTDKETGEITAVEVLDMDKL